MKRCLIPIMLLVMTDVASAESIVFPPDAGIVDVKAVYGAKGDGITDDTKVIQKAIDEVKGIPDTLCFPNGTYLVSDSVSSSTSVSSAIRKVLTTEAKRHLKKTTIRHLPSDRNR